MKKIILLLCYLNIANATPKKIQIIYLSPPIMKNSFLKKINPSIYLASYEDNLENCVPMGEGCFHPQIGYLDKRPEKIETPKLLFENEKIELNTFNSNETNLINCDKENFFDLYCGKTSKENKTNNEIEVWFDISTSLRSVDYVKDANHCDRSLFISRLFPKCFDKVKISVFNTILKSIDIYSNVCTSYGTNDSKRLLKWIKESQAKTLLIVTDVDEVSKEMKEFFSIEGAISIGDGVKAFTSTDLVSYANEFSLNCSK